MSTSEHINRDIFWSFDYFCIQAQLYMVPDDDQVLL